MSNPTAEDPQAAEPTTTPQAAGPTPDATPTPAEPAAVAAAEPAPAEPAGGKPSQRIQIGSQRAAAEGEPPKPKAEPKPVTEVTKAKPAKAPTKYPPPNVRAALSPEQEAELEAELAAAGLDELIDQSTAAAAAEIAPETKVAGRVKSVHGDNVFVDLGGHRQGAVPLKQFDGEPPEPGAELQVTVARLNADEGLYELGLSTAAVDVGDWDDISEGQVVEVSVTGVNKGGLECQASSIRGFMPMGQISLYRVEKPEDYVGQKLAAVVTEANPERRNLVVSHRAVMERERAEQREKLLAELAPGQVREGVVRSLRDFGAFVDLGGVDGLVHVSKMSWDRVNHPSEVLSEGQQIKVKVERIDPETGKIALSYRESAANPWDGVEGKYPVGGKATGTVSKTMDFGAFVKLEPGVEGLIHISELAHGRVFRTKDAVSEGQQVEVKVLSVDREKQRIGLSLKALMAAPAKPGGKGKEDADEDALYELPPDAPKAPKKKAGQLKGGTGGPSGGEQFGLKW
ncbi:MAG: S1 RNA-binding domain-containing protein [Planctomycetota bacterium]